MKTIERASIVLVCIVWCVACGPTSQAADAPVVADIAGEVLVLDSADATTAWNTKPMGGNSVEVATETGLVKEGQAAVRWKCVGHERERFGFALPEDKRDLSQYDQIQFWMFSGKHTAASVRPTVKTNRVEYRASVRINWEGWQLITIPKKRFGDDGSWADLPDHGKDVGWSDVRKFGFEEHTYREMGFYPLVDTDLTVDAVIASKKLIEGDLTNEIGTQAGPFVYVARIKNLSDKSRKVHLSSIQQRGPNVADEVSVQISPDAINIEPGQEVTAEVKFTVPAELLAKPQTMRGLVVSVHATLDTHVVPQLEFRVPTQRLYYDSLKLEHPRLYLNRQKLAELKKLIETDDRAAEMWKSLLADADKRLAAEVGKSRDNRQKIFPAVELAFAYLVTGDRKYAEKAQEYVEFGLKMENLTGKAERIWPRTTNLATGHNVMNLGLAYDWLYDFWTPEQRSALREMIVEKGLKEHYGDCRIRYSWGHPYASNWSSVVSGGVGVGALAVLGDEPEASKYVEFGTQRMERIAESQGIDGGTYEGTSYWGYNQRYASYYADALRTTTGGVYNLFRLQPFYHKTCYFYAGCMMPEGWWANFADAWNPAIYKGPNDSPSLQPHFLRMASEFKDGYLQWKAMHTSGGLFGLLWYDPSVKPVSEETRPLAQLHRGPDYMLLRSANGDTDAVALAMRAGNNSDGHGHFDTLNFIVSGYGYQLAADYWPSKYGDGYFGFERHLNKRAGTMGHNCFLIDGQLQTWGREVNADFDEFFHSQAGDYVQANGSRMYSPELLSKWKRNVLFVRPRYFVMWDELASPKPVKYEWRMMTWCEERDEPQLTEHGAIATSCAYEKRPDKAAQLKVAHVASPIDRMTLVDRFTFDPKVDRMEAHKRRNFFLKTANKIKTDKWTLLTMLFPVDKADSEGRGEFTPIKADGLIGATISDAKSKAGPDTVLVNLTDKPATSGDISFTGQAAMISGARSLKRFMLVVGTELKRGDITLISADKPVTAGLMFDGRELVGSIQAKEDETTVKLFAGPAKIVRLTINGEQIEVRPVTGIAEVKVPRSTMPDFLDSQHERIGYQDYK